MTIKEIEIQEALGSLPEEYRNNLCRYKTPQISKGTRRCHLCGENCIKKGNEFYRIDFRGDFTRYINICKTCSWLTIQTINRITDEHNAKLKQ